MGMGAGGGRGGLYGYSEISTVLVGGNFMYQTWEWVRGAGEGGCTGTVEISTVLVGGGVSTVKLPTVPVQ
jgi:hypothetical protein